MLREVNCWEAQNEQYLILSGTGRDPIVEKDAGGKRIMPEKNERFRPSFEKRKILLIEDEFINQQILQMFLQDAYEIVPAVTGAEALEIIHTQFETLSLILLDLNLPDIYGLDVLREVKADIRVRLGVMRTQATEGKRPKKIQ